MAEKIKFSDIFIKNKKYKDVSKIFSYDFKTVEEVKSDCIFVIDTNVLLLPFETEQKDLNEIEKIYRKLIRENRLFIPAQVAREFVDNRGDKLKSIYDYLNSRKQIELPNSNLGLNQFSPLLKSYPEFQDMIALENKLKDLIKIELVTIRDEYTKKINKLKEIASDWRWNDPVSLLYKSLFSEDVIIELNNFESNKEKIKKDHLDRIEHKVPPAFRDKDKDDTGIGDYLIWLTILQLGKGEQTPRNVVFVSQDNKNDWVEKSGDKVLYPKSELCFEFIEETGGKSFNIIPLSKLLEIFEADSQIVKNFKSHEKNIDIASLTGKTNVMTIVFNDLKKLYRDYIISLEYFDFDFVLQNDELQIGGIIKFYKSSSSLKRMMNHEIIKLLSLKIDKYFPEEYLLYIVIEKYGIEIDLNDNKTMIDFIKSHRNSNLYPNKIEVRLIDLETASSCIVYQFDNLDFTNDEYAQTSLF